MITATALRLETGQETKVCKCCHKEKPITEFFRNRLGYTNVCTECSAEHRKENKARKAEEKDLRRQLDDKRKIALSEFTPRELMLRLKELGYDGKLTYVETHVIELSKI